MALKIKHSYDDYGGYHEPVAYFRVKFRDVFSMKHFYYMLHEWVIEEDWCNESNITFPETFYLKRENQETGVESFIHWKFSRYPWSRTKAKTWRCDMFIWFHILHLKDTEVLHEGQKFKANTGEVEIKVWAHLVPDQFLKWKKNAFLRPWMDVAWKRFFYKEREQYKNFFYREVFRFQEAMKTYFKLVTFMPEPELQRFYQTKDFDRNPRGQ
ncbi:hypothetical protein J4410_01430 [Candidatus Woesearchaeota archaeon]|nr:hypothetical protein [Candidatus Woesearchaeota archaeon]